jgi:molybdopterin synthase sulfur carrier subunit
VAALRDELLALSPAHAQALSRHKPVRMALDQTMCDESATLHEGCELAFFPPVTGG